MSQMTAEQWQHVKSLLEECLQRPSRERVSFLNRNCDDSQLRIEVLSLLESHQDHDDFLEQPARAGTELIAALRPESLIGQRIGPYRLAEEIGRGGMGTVYRATRDDDEFDIQVAIKIVSRGMDTDLLLRRFRTERQILAGLDHPYIARLLDGGTTPGGLPYFVMEYVPGTPLTEYCNQQKLNILERLQLFRKVCEAVSYAHEHQVVHRDLKPANILVTEEGMPKLLDFGIARLMNTSSRGASGEPTVTMLRMATPAYASPEQIRGETAGVPTDVYSLGVILYELLTGHRPYRLPEGESAELARVICEREPTRASVVVGFNESIERSEGEVSHIDPERVCEQRDTTLDALRRLLRGDLDNILNMALRKEQGRRYETVEEFSEDIRRHLVGMPIRAHKDTPWYRAGKFVGRHRLGVAMGAVVSVLLCMTTFVAVRKAERLAERIQADHRLASKFLIEVHDAIARLPGSTPAREAMLQQSLTYMNGLAQDAGTEPSFRRSLATVYEKFAELQMGVAGPGLGRSADALETMRKAQVIREAMVALDKNDLQAQVDLGSHYLTSAYIAGRAGSAAIQAEFDRRALAIATRLIEADPRKAVHRSLLARAHISIAYTLQYEDKWEQARQHMREGLAIRTEMAAENPSDLENKHEIAQIHYRIGAAYVQSGQPALGREHLSQALNGLLRVTERDPNNQQYRYEIASAHHFLGMALAGGDDLKEALEHFDAAIVLRRDALAQDPRDARTRSMLAGNYSQRANVLLRIADRSAAVNNASEAVDLQQSVLLADPNSTPARISMAEFEARLGEVHMSIAESKPKRDGVQHWRDAAEWYARAAARYDALEKEGHLRSPQLRAEADRARHLLVRCRSAVAGS